MSTYAIGDVQGCYPELQRLLERLKFDPAADTLWFCGDLVNRGGESLEVLRLVHGIGERCIVVLGNHDLSLLAVAQRSAEAQGHVNPDLRRVLQAEDGPVLIDWLRAQKLIHHDEALDFTLVHAGIAPSWAPKQALRIGNEVERALRGPQHRALLARMFGNRPARWSSKLHGHDRLRAAINVLTRMRYCDVRGRIDFDAKGAPGTQRAGLYPWFSVPGGKPRDTRIVCGHWSTLGRFAGLGVYAIDTGCVWGGQLTALRLDEEEPRFIAVGRRGTGESHRGPRAPDPGCIASFRPRPLRSRGARCRMGRFVTPRGVCVADFPLFEELKRRNVLRAAVLYIGAVWALGQGLAQLGPALGLPDWATRWFLVAAAIGFPFWIAFAWFYEFTPSGLKRESEIDPADSIGRRTGRKLDYWIFGVMAVAIVLLLTNTFVLHHGVNEQAEIAAPPNSIAVLPFTNESSDRQQDYFADGIAEDLLNLLTEVRPLRVIARTSSFSFRGKGLGISEIAAKLHVANVLEGSVFKVGDEVRITAQLVRASDGYQIWSHSYDRKLTDIFAIQDGIAADVVKNLKIKLLGAPPTVRQTDPGAYALYLQARQLGGSAEAWKSSTALYRQVLAIDPRYVPAWYGIGGNFANEAIFGVLPAGQGLRQAREAAGKALAIDPDYAPALALLGGIAINQNDLPGAAQLLRRAVALDPADLEVLGNSANLLSNLGRMSSAIALNEYIVARDPVNPVLLFNLGGNYVMAGRYDDAIAKFRTGLGLNPDYSAAHLVLGEALLLKGDARPALAQMQQEKAEVLHLFGMALACHALGQKAQSDAALAALIAKHAKDSPYLIAETYAYRGETDLAFAWLDKAVQSVDPALSQGTQIDPLLDKLHADPRWLPFLRELGYAPEQLAKVEFDVSVPGATGANGGAASAGG
ncbi:MAG: symmetrical bis(5'-nucleosyl)-tetraphosphatase [Proteobacteria bacterium]|nr:symmetrical bis(5'-nucleosyl)-tetraphosphatase [Pseudomonadota bacterium]